MQVVDELFGFAAAESSSEGGASTSQGAHDGAIYPDKVIEDDQSFWSPRPQRPALGSGSYDDSARQAQASFGEVHDLVRGIAGMVRGVREERLRTAQEKGGGQRT